MCFPFQRIESEEARRRTKYLERENSRLGLEVKDLGKQVTILVMQVEAARAGQPPPTIPGKCRILYFEVSGNSSFRYLNPIMILVPPRYNSGVFQNMLD